MGAVLFLLTFGPTFTHPRVAAVTGLASSLLCLPLYLYLTTPNPKPSALEMSSRFNRAGAFIGTDGYSPAEARTRQQTVQ
jgi:hypothetical protein